MDRLDYVGYLARTVSPQRLARVAALRLWRTTKRPFERDPVPPTPQEVLRSFGVQHVAELPDRLAAPVPGPWGFGSPPGVASAARLLRTRLPEEAKRAVERAERALAGRVVIFGREVELPRTGRQVGWATPDWRAIDWEVDPVGGHRFDGPPAPGADVKFAWVAGRLEEAVHLACGAALVAATPCRSQRFADAALDRILDLFAAPRGVQWTCAMEVALRAVNVAIALRLLAGHEALERRPEALLEILRGLVLHLRWVDAHLEDDVTVPNNHLVADRVGQAVVGALLPRLPGAPQLARAALRALEAELLVQTLPDGFTFEGSVGYHRLAVELFLLAELAAASLAVPFGEAARARLARACAACGALVDGRGLAPQIGDADGGRALPFAPRHPMDLAFLEALGAARFGGAIEAEAPPPELVWLLGAAGLRALDAAPRRPRHRDTHLPDAGVAILRSERLSCAIACGPNGTGGTGTHGHNDKLSVEVCLDGRILLGDPGSGSYTGDPLLRDRLRGTAAHNTVVVEGQEQQPIPAGRLFALPEIARARCLELRSDELAACFVGEHRGYARLPQQVTHRRRVRLDRLRELLLIEDDIQGRGMATAEARFLVPTGRVEIRALRDGERRRALGLLPEARWDLVRVVEIDGRALLLAAGAAGPPRLEEGRFASGYGEVAHALHVCFPLGGALPIVFTAALLPMAGAAGRREEAESYGAA